MSTFTEKTTFSWGVLAALTAIAAAVGGGWIRLANAEGLTVQTAARVEALEVAKATAATEQALLRQELGTIRDAVNDMRGDVKRLLRQGVRPARGESEP